MADALVILGRETGCEGWGEAEFDAWLSFVCRRIDDATGLDVDVDVAHPRDVQEDRIEVYPHDGDGEECYADQIRGVLSDLWIEFCSTPEAWSAAARGEGEVAP